MRARRRVAIDSSAGVVFDPCSGTPTPRCCIGLQPAPSAAASSRCISWCVLPHSGVGFCRGSSGCFGGCRWSRDPPGGSPGLIGNPLVWEVLRPWFSGRGPGIDSDVVDAEQVPRPSSLGPFQTYDQDCHPSSQCSNSEQDAPPGSVPGVFHPRAGLRRAAIVLLFRRCWLGTRISNGGYPVFPAGGATAAGRRVRWRDVYTRGKENRGPSGAGLRSPFVPHRRRCAGSRGLGCVLFTAVCSSSVLMLR